MLHLFKNKEFLVLDANTIKLDKTRYFVELITNTFLRLNALKKDMISAVPNNHIRSH